VILAGTEPGDAEPRRSGGHEPRDASEPTETTDESTDQSTAGATAGATAGPTSDAP
jgi:hypothetical protein